MNASTSIPVISTQRWMIMREVGESSTIKTFL